MKLNDVKTSEDVKTFISNVIDQTVNDKMHQAFIEQLISEAHIKGVNVTTEEIKWAVKTSVMILNSVLTDIFINNSKEQGFEKCIALDDPNYFNIVMIMKIKHLVFSLGAMSKSLRLLFPNDIKTSIFTYLVEESFYRNTFIFTISDKFDIK